MNAVNFITSRDNALLKELRKLGADNTAYRKSARIWLEGDHLCGAALQRGVVPAVAVFAESFWPLAPGQFVQAATQTVVLADALFKDLSNLESPAHMGFVVDLPVVPALNLHAATVILDRVQDAGNVGSILRSAAAFGFHQIIALKGSAALWAPKVLRAGMGAHFGLALHEVLGDDALDALQLPIIGTSSHQGRYLHEMALPSPGAWVFGHEGQGVSAALLARASHFVRIAQPGGEESLNVAAAAAICLHAGRVVVSM